MGYLKNRAAVLQYQNISEDRTDCPNTWVYYKCFEEQLDYFSKNNIPIIPLCDVDAYIRGNLHVGKQSFSLTFDTGYVELYTLCYPLLKKFGYPATFFIRPDTVGKTKSINDRAVNYMNWDQIREVENDGMTIGMYGCKGRIATNVPLEEIEKEIKDARPVFEKELAKKVVYYSAREGIPTKQMEDLFNREGFNAFFCQSPTLQKTHPYAVGRIQIDDNDLNILLIKTKKTYVFLKDSRYWSVGRKCKFDKVVHLISNTINRLKGRYVS
jgi:peptidoglycan/xylan/chitin deacetylase (PgdA/CDA1 family)